MEKETFWTRIADIIFCIEFRDNEVREMYKDYEIEPVDEGILISVTDDDIEMTMKEHPEFTVGYNEGACIYRAIGEKLSHYDRLLMHGAAISYDENGFLFTAPSGTGKTTHISLWKRYLGDSVNMINGDKPVIHISDEGIDVCGTPWGGKENWQKNRIVPLKGICFLQQAKENKIEQVNPGILIGMLMQQVYLPKDEAAVAQTLYLLDKLTGIVPFYVLHCDMSEEAVKCSFEKMTGLCYEEKVSHNLENNKF